MVAEQCDVDLGFEGYHLPRVRGARSLTRQRAICASSATRASEQRYDEITPEITERLEHELDVIHDMGFDDYFLINHDLVHWAKNEAKMLVGPGRGSGASSIVAYALGITDLEPLGLGLIFERFLNPGRITMPDIDLDYPEDRRQEVIDYLTKRYGEDKTSQIATFGTMAARGAIRDVGRALGIPLDEVDRVAKLVPFGPKQDDPGRLGRGRRAQGHATTPSPMSSELIDYALAVQGISRHLSTHAAGVLVSDKPLVEYTPLQRAPKGEGIISQFCMEDVEEIGLLKLDVLGLSTLTVLDRAFKLDRSAPAASRLTQETIPMDDPDTYALALIGRGDGHLSGGERGHAPHSARYAAHRVPEIVAVLALYRPGPCSSSPTISTASLAAKRSSYRHPSLEPILDETYGIIVYQEQIIRIATELAGYTAAEADLMRRAVGKKKEKSCSKSSTANS